VCILLTVKLASARFRNWLFRTAFLEVTLPAHSHRTWPLVCAEAAGPLYVLVGATEMLFRQGFDIRRHALSLLANGDWGWVHSLMMVTTGLLTLAGAFGIHRVLRGTAGGSWGPALLSIYGLGLVGAGFFSADPALGFPPGTPLKGNPVSSHGIMHFVCGGIGFVGLIAACLVFRWRFARAKERAWSAFSGVTGVAFFAAFFGIAALSQKSAATRAAVNILFSFAVVLAWIWLSALAHRLKSAFLTEQPGETPRVTEKVLAGTDLGA